MNLRQILCIKGFEFLVVVRPSSLTAEAKKHLSPKQV